MLSAHGSAPDVVSAARDRGRFVVDAVCPLVTKVHHEARVRAGKGYTILYVGHAGHDEAIGTLAEAPAAMRLVEHEHDVDHAPVDDPTKVAVLAQTTLSLGDWKGVVERARAKYPDLWTATRDDLCFATTNRQAALTAIASRADAVLVIGSANSSNTLALEKVARNVGCPVVQRINGVEELDEGALAGARIVGVTAGASAPEDVVQAVIARLAPAGRGRGGRRHRRGGVLPTAPHAARGHAGTRRRGRPGHRRQPAGRRRPRRIVLRRPGRQRLRHPGRPQGL